MNIVANQTFGRFRIAESPSITPTRLMWWGVCFSLCILIFVVNNSDFPLVYLLPISFLFFEILFSLIIGAIKSPFVYHVIYFQLIVRYVLLPFLLSFGGQLEVGNKSMYSDTTVVLMIYELIFVFLSLYCWSKMSDRVFVSEKKGFRQAALIRPNFIPALVLAALTMYFIINIDLFQYVNFVWGFDSFMADYRLKSDDVVISSKLFIFLRFRVFFVLVFISAIKLSRMSNSKKAFFSCLLVLFNSVIIVGASRLSIIYLNVPFILIICYLYSEFRKKIILAGMIALAAILLFASVYKFAVSETFGDSNVISVNSLNSYFSGPGNIAVGIDVYEKNKHLDKLSLFANDLFQNVPGLTKFTTSFKTNNLFNYAIYGHKYYQDQILPSLISGVFHFGYVFCGFYSFFFLLLALKFEQLASKKESIEFKYVYLLLSLNCSLFLMINISSIFANIVGHICFTLLPFFLIHRLSLMRYRVFR